MKKFLAAIIIALGFSLVAPISPAHAADYIAGDCRNPVTGQDYGGGHPSGPWICYSVGYHKPAGGGITLDYIAVITTQGSAPLGQPAYTTGANNILLGNSSGNTVWSYGARFTTTLCDTSCGNNQSYNVTVTPHVATSTALVSFNNGVWKNINASYNQGYVSFVLS